jgi:LysR family transcriptional regulator of beta-lactamase
MVESAIQCGGAVLVPANMFSREVQSGQLVQPFPIEVDLGSYWLTQLKSRAKTPAIKSFENWLIQQVAAG